MSDTPLSNEGWVPVTERLRLGPNDVDEIRMDYDEGMRLIRESLK